MKPILRYQGKAYSYIVIGSEVITFRVDGKSLKNDFEFDTETQKQLEAEFAGYEANLTKDEMKIWRGEK